MKDAALVRVMHGPSERFHQPCRLLLRLCRTGDFAQQAAAVDVLQGKERPAIIFAHFINLHDVGVLQAGHGFRLGAEAQVRLGVGLKTHKDHFERHQALERTVPGLVDNAHAPTSQFRDNLVTRHGREVRVACLCGLGKQTTMRRFSGC